MAQLEPLSWLAIGLSSPDEQTMWAQIEKQLADIGFVQPGLVQKKPLLDRSFPSSPELLGHVVSSEFEQRFRYSNTDQYTGVAISSSYGAKTYINPEALLSSELPSQAKHDLGEIYEYGLVRGWTTPVRDLQQRRVSVLLLATSLDGPEFDRLLAEHESTLELCAAFLVEAQDLRSRVVQAKDRNLLSKRERECLAWASLGLSAKQIADKLNIADSTATEYLSRGARKLGASNRAQAIARAIALGLIAQ